MVRSSESYQIRVAVIAGLRVVVIAGHRVAVITGHRVAVITGVRVVEEDNWNRDLVGVAIALALALPAARPPHAGGGGGSAACFSPSGALHPSAQGGGCAAELAILISGLQPGMLRPLPAHHRGRRGDALPLAGSSWGGGDSWSSPGLRAGITGP